MIHFTTTVSRKTPADGRLEISESLASRLSELETPIQILLGGEESVARVEDMACTCARGGGNHQHHFLTADLLKSLPAGASARLTIDVDRGVVAIEAA